MRVLFTTNIPSPYRVAFFNELGKHCELHVLFERKASNERDKSWSKYNFINFNGIFIKGIALGDSSKLCLTIGSYIKKINPEIVVVCNFSNPTGIILVNYCIKHKIKYYVEADGGFEVTKKSGFKYKLKKKMFNNAIGCFSSAKESDKYYTSCEVNQDKLIRYHFSSIFRKDIIKNKEKNNDKIKLLFVGQFIHRKGVDVLLKSVAKIKELDFHLDIVGGLPTEEYLNIVKENGIEDKITFCGFKPFDEIKNMMNDADVFVLPTREDIWGLVINEAMAFGDAIITTNRCIAGLELIENGKNGFMVDVDNVDALANAMKTIITNKNMLQLMQLNSLLKIKDYTIEQMVEDHLAVFQKEVEQCKN